MNTRFRNSVEVIGVLEELSAKGQETYHGDRVVGIHVRQTYETPTVRLDIQQPGGGNLMLSIELHELVAAISLATVKREK